MLVELSSPPSHISLFLRGCTNSFRNFRYLIRCRFVFGSTQPQRRNPQNDLKKEMETVQGKYMTCMSLVTPVVFVPLSLSAYLLLSLAGPTRVFGVCITYGLPATRQFSKPKSPIGIINVLEIKAG